MILSTLVDICFGLGLRVLFSAYGGDVDDLMTNFISIGKSR